MSEFTCESCGQPLAYESAVIDAINASTWWEQHDLYHYACWAKAQQQRQRLRGLTDA